MSRLLHMFAVAIVNFREGQTIVDTLETVNTLSSIVLNRPSILTLMTYGTPSGATLQS